MTNLNIIADYLFENPGARFTDITQHLCKVKGKAWSRGFYSRYFSIGAGYQSRTEYAGVLWRKSSIMQGWMLTPRGLLYTTPRNGV